MEKLENLKNIILNSESAVIAFSGGVDSTFLAKVAKDTLGTKVLLITATSSTYPERELQCAKNLAKEIDLLHRIIISEELDIDGFSDNPPDRCYYCKRELFLKIKQIALNENYKFVFDGSNLDDLGDYRPGRRALKELGIRSPLCEANLTKEDVRKYSAYFNLKTAYKPALACLASRFPYGEKITKGKLDRVGTAEEFIFNLGFKQFRVRSHGDVARIEIAEEEMESAWIQRAEIYKICKSAGFVYAALDLQGYRTGAMNEMLSVADRSH
jgi:pyridinium-3,5-biscarboxylic acid mononucleotide sulfurtransferase